jgi:hypothetical protein
METTRQKIERLGREYLEDENYKKGFISLEWVEKLNKELNLTKLSDLELANMWDMVYLTLDHKFNYYDGNENYINAIKWMDVKSAFVEVVNKIARERR